MNKIEVKKLATEMMADTMLSSLSLSADAVTSEFNELIDELNGKVGAVDETLDASSKNPVTNAATTAGLETKHPIVYDYKELGALGEFHSIASNDDGSVVVFGGDEQGDGLKKPIYCSIDGLRTI
jgi:hypothetical protein